jgi:hypothetical protein
MPRRRSVPFLAVMLSLAAPAALAAAPAPAAPAKAPAPPAAPALVPMQVLILAGGTTPADPVRWLEAQAPALARLRADGGGFAEGYPRALESATVKGLRPGFHVVVAGYCAPGASAAPLAVLRKPFPGTYERRVEVPADRASCPALVAGEPGAELSDGDVVRLAVRHSGLAPPPGASAAVAGSARGRLVALAGGRAGATAPSVALLLDQVARSEDGEGSVMRHAPALVLAGRKGGKPALLAALPLAPFEARADASSADTFELALGTLALAPSAVAVTVRRLEASGGDGYGKGAETTTVYVVRDGAFEEVWSEETARGESASDHAAGTSRTRGEELRATLEVGSRIVNGLAELELRAVLKTFDGCPGPRGVVEPCTVRAPGDDADADGEGDDGDAGEELSGTVEEEPTVTRWCFDGAAYRREACPAADGEDE